MPLLSHLKAGQLGKLYGEWKEICCITPSKKKKKNRKEMTDVKMATQSYKTRPTADTADEIDSCLNWGNE